MSTKTNRSRRAAIVAAIVLVPSLGLVGSAWAAQTFTDVPPDHPFYAEIEWGAASGVIEGYPDGTFRPSNTVTRQAVAAFMARYNNAIHTVTATSNPTSAAVFSLSINCPAGERVLTGSGNQTAQNLYITDNYALDVDTWFVRWESDNDVAQDPTALYGSALCAPLLLP